MNRDQAKHILLLYRPDSGDAQDVEIAEALALAQQDSELGAWLEQHQAFQSAMRAKLRQLEPPQQLKAAILANHKKIIRPPFWRQPPVWAAAVAALVLGLALLLSRPGNSANSGFGNFEAMMVSKALRGYVMDWWTNDLSALRGQLAQAQAPGNFDLPKGLAELQLTGGAHLTWRAHPVAMVCFKRPDRRDVWLFVLNRAALKDPPPQAPRLQPVDRLMTASWSRGENVYVLAAPPESDFLERYF